MVATISLAGTKIIADKMGEVQMLIQLTPFLMNLMEGARQDSYYNYHLRSIVRAMGFNDIEKRVPPDPGQFITDPNQRAALNDQMNQVMSTMSASL